MSTYDTTMYHRGHRALQDRFDGRRMADALENHRRLSEFRDEDIEFIQSAEFFFLATAHGDSVDCSFRGGSPGFVKVTGPTGLEWPDYDGNSMYRSLGNILESPRLGLLFIRFGSEPRRLRVNGACQLIDPQPGDPYKLRVRVEADEIFPNCPRYIPNLLQQAPSAYLPDDTGVGAKPAWKGARDLSDALPGNDPHL